MALFVLTVQSLNNGNYRLGLFASDHVRTLQNLNGEEVFVSLPGMGQNIQVGHDTWIFRTMLTPVTGK